MKHSAQRRSTETVSYAEAQDFTMTSARYPRVTVSRITVSDFVFGGYGRSTRVGNGTEASLFSRAHGDASATLGPCRCRSYRTPVRKNAGNQYEGGN